MEGFPNLQALAPPDSSVYQSSDARRVFDKFSFEWWGREERSL